MSLNNHFFFIFFNEVFPYCLIFFNLIFFYFKVNYSFFFMEKKNTIITKGTKVNNLSFNFLKYFLSIHLIIGILFNPQHSTNIVNIYSLEKFEILFLCTYIFILMFFKINSFDWALTSYLYFLSNIFLLYSFNIVNLYLLMEINSYIFILLLVLQKNSTQGTYKRNTNCLIIFFILNFFTSFFFILFICFLVKNNGPINYMYTQSSPQINLFLFVFVLKSIVGPWLYLNLFIYKGILLQNLLLYSTGFVTIILPKLTSLLVVFFLKINPTLIFIFIASYFIFLIKNINNISTLKPFLAYSTSIYFFFAFMFCTLNILC